MKLINKDLTLFFATNIQQIGTIVHLPLFLRVAVLEFVS